MFPKTEPAENIPKSTPQPSMDSIVRDLRSLEKSFISSKERGKNQLNIMQTKVKRLEFENIAAQSELEDMKSKISLLEDQNSKLKSDLKASDLNKNLYYNQCQENGRMVRELEAENASFTIDINKLKKEVQELKLKNKFLKAEMKLLRTSKLESEISKSENSDEPNRSANVNKSGDSVSGDPDITRFGDVVDEAPEWTRSKLSSDEETSNDTSNDELHKSMQDQKSSREQKRKSRSEDESEKLPKSKKPCPRYNLRERKGNVIEQILERKFWPLPPPTFCAFEMKYLIKWKESKYGLALDDTWERKEDITKELEEFESKEKRNKYRKPKSDPCD